MNFIIIVSTRLLGYIGGFLYIMARMRYEFCSLAVTYMMTLYYLEGYIIHDSYLLRSMDFI